MLTADGCARVVKFGVIFVGCCRWQCRNYPALSFAVEMTKVFNMNSLILPLNNIHVRHHSHHPQHQKPIFSIVDYDYEAEGKNKGRNLFVHHNIYSFGRRLKIDFCVKWNEHVNTCSSNFMMNSWKSQSESKTPCRASSVLPLRLVTCHKNMDENEHWIKMWLEMWERSKK